MGGFALALFALYVVLASLYVPAAIYPFDDRPFADQAYMRHEIARSGAPPLVLHVADAGPGRPVVLYFMGNAGSLVHFVQMLDHHRAAGRSVVALAYRGGGGTPGRPGEAVLKTDALAARDAIGQLLPAPGPVVVQGYSLGTGLALHVSARRDTAAVVLAAPYARLCRLIARRSALPACAMWWIDRWRADLDAPNVDAPVLILHGTADKLIPIGAGERLRDVLERREQTVTRFVRVEGAGHNDVSLRPGSLDEIDRFLAASLD